MRSLSNSDLLHIWEQGTALHPLDRGLLVLSGALPETPGGNPADWPLGRRNRALAELHARWFGPTLAGWLTCVRCQEKLEFAMDASEFAGSGVDGDPAEPATIRVKGSLFRLPTSRDLASVMNQSDPRSAAVQMLERCRVAACESVEWSNEDVEEAGRAMSEADPFAELQLNLRCPSCGHESRELLDVAAFLWEEIEGRAKRLLFEIHALARAYGWAERDILSLSDVRRSAYMDMVQA
jgi:hypothetical protein